MMVSSSIYLSSLHSSKARFLPYTLQSGIIFCRERQRGEKMQTIFSDEVVPVAELRKNLSSYLEKVRNGQPISIVQGDKADVALIRRDTLRQVYGQLEEARKAVAELERLIETYEILADDDLMDKIRRSEEDIAQGRFISLEDLKAELGLK
ncbi:MAG TPA: type II toxin-antitoxin system Phd/YefM family antitoxin [Desulfobacterales bacterium]|nr:type II toxin-antitoxin system Phd/YefM family antitoxin [Desulfobacterales bacterium]